MKKHVYFVKCIYLVYMNPFKTMKYLIPLFNNQIFIVNNNHLLNLEYVLKHLLIIYMIIDRESLQLQMLKKYVKDYSYVKTVSQKKNQKKNILKMKNTMKNKKLNMRKNYMKKNNE